ncbi:hypothetical protein CEXT_308111 [Caerostris extrusa]|uniref:Uncharacterized protein n=1 Tax=Caerostris extrusa TaxID=172846 RepID=A0AAV4U7T5_CAEEX|nr:hypothetical protein CEXT_308111 [Caerostris extrusa]
MEMKTGKGKIFGIAKARPVFVFRNLFILLMIGFMSKFSCINVTEMFGALQTVRQGLLLRLLGPPCGCNDGLKVMMWPRDPPGLAVVSWSRPPGNHAPLLTTKWDHVHGPASGGIRYRFSQGCRSQGALVTCLQKIKNYKCHFSKIEIS